MNFLRLNKSDFNNVLEYFNVNNAFILNKDNLFDVYNFTCDYIEDAFKSIIIKQYSPVNPIVIILYILNEVNYFLIKNNKKNLDIISNTLSDEEFKNEIASKIADKYLTNEQLNFKSQSFLNKFNPEISSLSLYLNFLLNVLTHLSNLNKYQDLLKNMLTNCFSLAKCIENLLISGFEVEAFSTRRTMHENECIIYCLLKYGKNLFDAYFKHIEYSLAYRGQIKDKDRIDNLFVEIKDSMKAYSLKSKDTKKFIEYGYLFAIPNIQLNVDFKLNFRDGIEKIAGLENYSSTYELSSEVAHSSPLLIFSNKEYYFNITMLNLYESFLRLESVFYNFYCDLSNDDEIKAYQNMREIYLNELKEIHNNLQLKFKESN